MAGPNAPGEQPSASPMEKVTVLKPDMIAGIEKKAKPAELSKHTEDVKKRDDEKEYIAQLSEKSRAELNAKIEAYQLEQDTAEQKEADKEGHKAKVHKALDDLKKQIKEAPQMSGLERTMAGVTYYTSKGLSKLNKIMRPFTNMIKDLFAGPAGKVFAMLGLKPPSFAEQGAIELRQLEKVVDSVASKSNSDIELAHGKTDAEKTEDKQSMEKLMSMHGKTKTVFLTVNDFLTNVVTEYVKVNGSASHVTVKQLLANAEKLYPEAISAPINAPAGSFESLKEKEELRVDNKVTTFDINGTKFHVAFTTKGMISNAKETKMRLGGNEVTISSVMRVGSNLEIKFKDAAGNNEQTVKLAKAAAEDAIQKTSKEEKFEGGDPKVSFEK